MGPLLIPFGIGRGGFFPGPPERRSPGAAGGRALRRAGLTWLLLSGGLMRPTCRLLQCRMPVTGIRLAMAGGLLGNGAAAQQG